MCFLLCDFARQAATLLGDTGTYIETSEWPNHTHTRTLAGSAKEKLYCVSYTKNKQKQLKKRDNGSTSFMPRISTFYRRLSLCPALESTILVARISPFSSPKSG